MNDATLAYQHMLRRLATFMRAMKKEQELAREQFSAFNSLHEGYAVLLEEVEELKAQVFARPSQRSKTEIVRECIQIATMAFCIVDECVGDVHPEEIENYRIPDDFPF